MTREDAVRKVRALRATATAGSGATEPERATAQRLADGLVARFGLDRPSSREAPTITLTVNAADLDFPTFSRGQWENTIMAAIRGKSQEELLRRKKELFRDILSRLENP